MYEVVYNFDGGGGGDDSPAGWGWVRNDGTAGHGALAPGTTSNVAEYTALTMAIHDALARWRDNGDSSFLFQGDSKLIVEQVLGNWQVKALHLRKFCREAQMLLDGLPVWSLAWIPRTQNSKADEQAWLGKAKWLG